MACAQDPNLKGSDLPFLADIAQAGSVHDVGKITIPVGMLCKTDKLNDEEFKVIKTHVEEGEKILSQAGLPGTIISIVACHHERLDGSGYPRGLKGYQISMGARILMYVDMYDAMTHDRCYRKAKSVDEAVRIIEEDAESGKLDPKILPDFLACVKEGRFRPYAE